MRRLIQALCLVAITTGSAAAQDPVIQYAPSDLAMAKAISSARESLPLFLDHAFGPDGISLEGHLVKVGFPTEDGPSDWEHIWVTPFNQIGPQRFAGLLANEPNYLGDLRNLDPVEFSGDMISDWMIHSPQGRYYGAFTVRVMHADGVFGATPADEIFEPEPIPPE